MNIHSRATARLLCGIFAVSSLAFLAAACGGDDEEATPTAIVTGGTATIVPTAATSPTTATSPATATSPTAAASASAAASPSAAASSPTTVTTAATVAIGTGGMLTNSAGFTLYTFDNDTPAGKSVCNGNCAVTWPPLLTTATATAPTVSGATGAFTIITRDDGTKQIAYKDKPLYLYRSDTAPGQTTGNGVGGVWRTAMP